MPRVCKKTKRRHAHNENHIWALMTGKDFFNGFGGAHPDREAMREAWFDPRVRRRVYRALQRRRLFFETRGERPRLRPWAEEEFGAIP